VETQRADRGALSERLERAIEDGRALTLRLAETQPRSGELSELLRERDAAAETLTAEREDLATHVATLSGQLQAAQEAIERTRAAFARERSTIERERDEWKEQVAFAREELSLSD
jgi:chromosome segregation ATPase